MEFSKLIISRQDVVVVSDTEAQSKREPGTNKKKSKSKLECVRKVQLTKMTVDRIVPNCYRQKCRHAHYYHRMAAKNTKYTKGKASSQEKNKSESNSGNNSSTDHQILSSPITIESGSDTFERISLCSYSPPSSDSDELEDLIKVTRQRMKNEEEKFNYNSNRLFNRHSSGTTFHGFYKNISHDDGRDNNSIQPMETLVIHHNVHIPSPPSSPENPNHFVGNKTEDIGATFLCNTTGHSGNEVAPPKSLSPMSQVSERSLSPFYEISGKVFMEHYLNTSIF